MDPQGEHIKGNPQDPRKDQSTRTGPPAANPIGMLNLILYWENEFRIQVAGGRQGASLKSTFEEGEEVFVVLWVSNRPPSDSGSECASEIALTSTKALDAALIGCDGRRFCILILAPAVAASRTRRVGGRLW